MTLLQFISVILHLKQKIKRERAEMEIKQIKKEIKDIQDKLDVVYFDDYTDGQIQATGLHTLGSKAVYLCEKLIEKLEEI